MLLLAIIEAGAAPLVLREGEGRRFAACPTPPPNPHLSQAWCVKEELAPNRVVLTAHCVCCTPFSFTLLCTCVLNLLNSKTMPFHYSGQKSSNGVKILQASRRPNYHSSCSKAPQRIRIGRSYQRKGELPAHSLAIFSDAFCDFPQSLKIVLPL